MKQRSPWVIFFGLLLGTFVTIEAAGFQAPAIPEIIKNFGVPAALSGFNVLFYYVGSTVFGPVMGHFADIYGRKRIILLGLVIFAASEFMAALSPNFTFFLVARLIQGFGVACIVPAAIAFIGMLFPEGKRGLPFGVLAAVGSAGAAVGSMLAGFLVKSYGWSIIYWVSGVLALIGIAVVGLVVNETPKQQKRSFDYFGTMLLFVSLGSLLSVTTLGNSMGWTSPYTLTTLAIGIVGVLLLWLVEKRSASPVVDLSLLKQRQFSLTMAILFIGIGVQMAITYSLIFFLSGRPGGSASDVGFVNMFVYIAGALGGVIAGKFFIDRFKTKYVVIANYIIFILGALMYSQADASTALSYIVGVVLVVGYANGAQGASLLKLATGVVPKDKLSRGSGLIVMIRDSGVPLGGASGLAFYSAVSASKTNGALIDHARQAGVSENLLPAVEQAGRSAGKVIDSGLTAQLQTLGLKFDDLLKAAKLEGIGLTVQSIGYILIGVTVLLILASIFLPDDKPKAEQAANAGTGEAVTTS